MKSITLKTTKETVVINGAEVEQEFKTIDLIKGAVNQTPQVGLDITDMQNRIRILDALDKVNGSEELSLEDRDYENLQQYVKVTKWAVISRTIIEFVNSFIK